MKAFSVLVLFIALSFGGCRKPPSAMDVCLRLEKEQLATQCTVGQVGGLGSAAREHVDFDLPSNPGHKGQVLAFNELSDLQATDHAYEAMAALAGRHRYASSKARIFVQLNAQTPEEAGQRIKKIIEQW